MKTIITFALMTIAMVNCQAPSTHYGNPFTGYCKSDETRVGNNSAAVCAASCTYGSCPLDAPYGTNLRVNCMPANAYGNRFCALYCTASSRCPYGASCYRLNGLSEKRSIFSRDRTLQAASINVCLYNSQHENFLPGEIELVEEEPKVSNVKHFEQCKAAIETFKNTAVDALKSFNFGKIGSLVEELQNTIKTCKTEVMDDDCVESLEEVEKSLEHLKGENFFGKIKDAVKIAGQIVNAFHTCAHHESLPREIEPVKHLKVFEQCHTALHNFKEHALDDMKHFNFDKIGDLVTELHAAIHTCKVEIKDGDCGKALEDVEHALEDMKGDNFFKQLKDAIEVAEKVHDAYETCKQD